MVIVETVWLCIYMRPIFQFFEIGSQTFQPLRFLRGHMDMSGSVVEFDIDSGVVSQVDRTNSDLSNLVQLSDSCCMIAGLLRKRRGPDQSVIEIYVLYSTCFL